MTNRNRTLMLAATILAVTALSRVTLTGAEEALPIKGEPMRGTWGFSASGTIVPPATTAPTPAVAVGLMTFETTGNCLFQDTVNIGGASLSRTSTSCTYAMASGRGVINVTFPDGPVPLSFVLVDHDREMRFIRTDLGVAEGVAKLQ